MKAVRKFVLLVSLGVTGVVAASANTLEQTYVDAYPQDRSVPVPVKVVSPTISSDYAGRTVNVDFTVDQKGRPVDFSVVSPAEPPLASAVVQAVKHWEFRPALRDGVPVAMKVTLPVRILAPAEAPVFAAAN